MLTPFQNWLLKKPNRPRRREDTPDFIFIRLSFLLPLTSNRMDVKTLHVILSSYSFLPLCLLSYDLL